MTTRKKKPEKPRRAKAAPKRAASVAAERDAARAFELGEQMTALRQERDRAAAESATRLKALLEVRASLERMDEHIRRHEEELAAVGAEAAKAQAELAQVANVLDEWGPQHQREGGSYVSHSSAVREALEGLRKQRDSARSHAIKAKAAEIKLLEAQARIASLEATIPLETAELHSRVADYEVELRMSSRERTELRAILDAVARALTGQDPGPLDAAFMVAADVSKLRGRVRELEGALHRDKTGLGLGLAEVLKVVKGFGWIGRGEWGDYSFEARTVETMRAEAAWALNRIGELASGALAASGKLARAMLSFAAPPEQAPAQSQADGGARPCRDCRHSSRCKWLLGPSYKDAGPCDWSPSRFAAAGQDDATPTDDGLLRVVEGFLRTWDEQNGDGNTTAPAIPEAVAALRRVLKLVKERPDGDPAIHAALAADAGADWRTRGRALFAAVTALDDWLDEPPKTNAKRTRILIGVYKALEGWLEIDPGAQRADVGAVSPVADRPRVEPGICPKCRDFNVYGTETQCADCTAREAARSTAPAGAGTAPDPEEHVHGCARCGAHIPCSSEVPDACRDRVDAHCQAQEAKDVPDDS